LGSSLSFSWSRIVFKHIEKHRLTVITESWQNANCLHNVNFVARWVYTVMITLMPAVLMGLIVYYSGAFSLAELDQNKTVANLYGYFLTGFVSA
jgi:ABC-type transporter Mla maintaining outer membrane lipid asymmetry permease subunit MlaE